MIEVTANKHKIRVKGHANFGPKGYDIVCAAVSSLVNTTLNSLKSFKKSEVIIKDGDVTIDIKHKVKRDDQVRLEMLVKGLKLIAKQYPDKIKVKEKLIV